MAVVARNSMLRRAQIVGILIAILGASPLIVYGLSFLLHAARYPRLDLQTAGAFPFDEKRGVLSDVPLRLRQLDGHRVSIKGYMLPMDQAERITEFAVVPFYAEWSDMPSMQQTAIIRMPAGKTTPYIPAPVRVDGILHVAVVKSDDQYVVSIFNVTPDSVAAAPTMPALSWPCVGVASGLATILIPVLVDALIAYRKRMEGLCRRCGYDLRASPVRCPECGTPTARKRAG
jgi:hypothetical protein